MGLRIIGGKQRGRKLLAVKGLDTRPTANRMRESLFNILSTRVIGSHVLDLFAGTGALGMEALSRGAASAVFIDKAREALSVMGRNIEIGGWGEQARIIKWNIVTNLKCLKGWMPPFDMVFMDPPYHTGCVQKALKNLCDSDCLSAAATIVVEHSIEEQVPETLFGWEVVDQRIYSRTVFSFLHLTSTAEKETLA
ncbi:MAG: 16S rRNA (guanine(966)-N(2))-methyltransferase RsmD [Desulfobacteraceae bacterium]|nr:MAG: 16S rRNA (guanine(966)-N(2))-methyltransferase RsmD [Desulfobacteraceae bacterium]